jgi:23S rRNA (guanine2445-N2)-methyltransferase
MTMYLYQENKRYFAQYAAGFDAMATKELAELGAESIAAEGNGAHFTADARTLYRINYMSRVITRVLAPLFAFDCQSTDQLYNEAKSIDWAGVFDPARSFAVFANVRNSAINHSQFAALRLKDAIVDRFRETGRKRPRVDRHVPDCGFNLFIHKDRAVVSLDTSGGSLHRRGYRQETVEAPFQETLAAAILEMARWDGDRKVYDPMCGSGTLMTEALMRYCRIPAGYLRQRFGFQRLPDFNPIAWRALKNEMDRQIRPLPPGRIAGSDLSPQAVHAARTNIGLLPFARRVPIQVSDFRKITRLEQSLIICNPPYGIRLEKDRDLSGFYQTLGDFLKQRCQASTAYIYFGDRDYIKSIGLKSSWKQPLSNGGLDGRLVKYELY